MNFALFRPAPDKKLSAFRLILFLGLVSLFGDIVYEGARSVNGPYLEVLAANAAVVGFVAGAGEFIGYALRLLTGYLSDRTRSYWVSVFIGYGLLASVPLLSLTGAWQTAAVLILMERIGKAVRSPGRDTLISQAGAQVGTGLSFGLHEALDQLGALSGPLIFTVFFALTVKGAAGPQSYRNAYSLLWIPFALVVFLLISAFLKFPRPDKLEPVRSDNPVSDKLSGVFWLYTAFIFFAACGFANFLLISFHFKSARMFNDTQIPLLYALAMGVDGIAALSIGKVYDLMKKKRGNINAGLELLVFIPFLSALIPAMAFAGSSAVALSGMCVWGVVMGVHETIMRSAIADITPLAKRGLGYGIFNTSYGLAMLVGASLQGLLYTRSVKLMIVFTTIAQVAALVIFIMLKVRIGGKRVSSGFKPAVS
ncbi:MAG: MFS transporter [Candidatus Omnitrophota bacterium]|jgi:predicted MFS family arabinose efflux permease